MAAHAGEAGIPVSVVVVEFDRTPEVSEQVIADDHVAAVTLTGSTGAGRSVAGRALEDASAAPLLPNLYQNEVR